MEYWSNGKTLTLLIPILQHSITPIFQPHFAQDNNFELVRQDDFAEQTTSLLARPAGEFCGESPLSEYLPGGPFFSEFKPFEPVGTKSVAAVTLLKIGESLAAINLFYFKAGNLD